MKTTSSLIPPLIVRPYNYKPKPKKPTMAQLRAEAIARLIPPLIVRPYNYKPRAKRTYKPRTSKAVVKPTTKKIRVIKVKEQPKKQINFQDILKNINLSRLEGRDILVKLNKSGIFKDYIHKAPIDWEEIKDNTIKIEDLRDTLELHNESGIPLPFRLVDDDGYAFTGKNPHTGNENSYMLKISEGEEFMNILYESALTKKICKYNYMVVSFSRYDKNGELHDVFITLNEYNIDKIREMIIKGNAKKFTADDERIEDYNSIMLSEWVNWSFVTIQFKEVLSGKNKNRDGAFFRYNVKAKVFPAAITDGWKKYGLFINIVPKDLENNCLINAIITQCEAKKIKLHDDVIKSIKLKCTSRSVPLCKLNEICDLLKMSISLKYHDPKNVKKDRFELYGDCYANINKLYIGCIDAHFFSLDSVNTNITKYALHNYKDISDVESWNTIYRAYNNSTGMFFKKDNTSKYKITSYDLILFLLADKNKYLDPITLSTPKIMSTNYYRDIKKDNISDIYVNEDNCRPVRMPKTFTMDVKTKEGKEKEMITPNDVMAADFESIVSEGNHIPFILCLTHMNKDNKKISKTFVKQGDNFNFITKFLLYAVHNAKLVLFHNLAYDFRMLLKYGGSMFQVLKTLLVGQKVYEVEIMFDGKKIKLRDSYPLISTKLKDFGKMFSLSQKKEIVNYDYYTSDNIKVNNASIEKYSERFSTEEKKNFVENIDTWKLRVDENNFNHVSYCVEYCKIDCDLLLSGYFKFRDWMFTLCDVLKIKRIDTINIISIGSYAKHVFAYSGCFGNVDQKLAINKLQTKIGVLKKKMKAATDAKRSLGDVNKINSTIKELSKDQVYEFSGVIQQFIQKCTVGGRCMSANNKAYHIKTINKNNLLCADVDGVEDLDACSLYPSAMRAMKGFIIGKPKVLSSKQLDINFLNTTSNYFVEVNIKNVPKYLDFPTISYVNKNSVRMFDNDYRGITFVDKTSLEDMIDFHKMQDKKDFEVIRGYYFDQGHNNIINSVIQKLYDERVIKKKEKNAIQIVYKLLLNASYGKLIEKPKESNLIIKNGEKTAMEYIYRNYNYIQEYNIVSTGAVRNTETDKYFIKRIKPIANHFNQCHNGAYVLSMSKRIMNRVQTIAQDNNIPIYYQDTDSLHIRRGEKRINVDILGKLFKEKYGCELYGEGMGQFHYDFDISSDDCAPKSTETYILGKKLYMHKIEGITNGIIINKNHVRVKGIPNYCIEDADKFFKQLKQGKRIKIDISEIAKRLSKPLFKNHKSYNISHNLAMSRSVECYNKVKEILL